MLDIRVIRENPEEVKARLKPRSGDAWKLVDDVLACDEARRNAETEKQALQSERNATSKQIGMLKKKGEDTSSIEARVREIGDRIRELDRVAEENAAQLTSLLMNIPNLPHLECPVGADETANPEIKLWGEKPAIENPKDHVELAANLGMISFEDGARITGSGFVVYRGAGARLERALINFLLNEEKGASIMGSECGIPASKAGLAAAQAAGAVKSLVAEANAKVMAFTTNKLDPLFENNDLKASGTGIYQEVFDTVDYDGVAGADVVDTLLDGMESVGYTIG